MSSAWRRLPNRPSLGCDHVWAIVHTHGDKHLASMCSVDDDADTTYRCDGNDGTRIGYCAQCSQAQMFPKHRLLARSER